MTVATEDLVDSASIAAASTKRKSLWLVALRNPMVIIGGSILLIMLAIAVLAPLLGTVDPTRIDPASRNKKPGTEITNIGDSLFWTTTQLLTVSSQLPNPISTPARVLDVWLQAYAISVVAALAGSFGAFFHRRGMERDPLERQGEPG